MNTELVRQILRTPCYQHTGGSSSQRAPGVVHYLPDHAISLYFG